MSSRVCAQFVSIAMANHKKKHDKQVLCFRARCQSKKHIPFNFGGICDSNNRCMSCLAATIHLHSLGKCVRHLEPEKSTAAAQSRS